MGPRGTHLSLSCKNITTPLYSKSIYQKLFDSKSLIWEPWANSSCLKKSHLKRIPWKPPASTSPRAFPSCAFSVCTSISKALREMHFINLVHRFESLDFLGEMLVVKLQLLGWVDVAFMISKNWKTLATLVIFEKECTSLDLEKQVLNLLYKASEWRQRVATAIGPRTTRATTSQVSGLVREERQQDVLVVCASKLQAWEGMCKLQQTWFHY